MRSRQSEPRPETGADLFALIEGLDEQYRGLGTRLPDEVPPVAIWAGVLFRIRRQSFLAPLGQIIEVLEPPADFTELPGTKPWVLGVTNNRGTLLPIFDLPALAYGETSSRRDTDRILVVRQDEPPCGLLVSAAIGIRHFESGNRRPEPPPGLDILAPFVEAAYQLGGEPIPVLSLGRLMSDPLLSAAAQ